MDLPSLDLISRGPFEGTRSAIAGGLGKHLADRRGLVQRSDAALHHLPPLPVEDGLDGRLLPCRLDPPLLPGGEVVLQSTGGELEGPFLLLLEGGNEVRGYGRG